jgi:ATP-dependent RNA helicase SUPV3L1/SUV3
MPKRSRDLITINHLPGILLASNAECERWIEAGLIPVAERETYRRWGRTHESRMFDPEVITALAAEVPEWRAQDEANIRGRPADAAQIRPDGTSESERGAPVDDIAHRCRQSLLAPVRKNTGIYIAEDIRKLDNGDRSRGRPHHKLDRVFAGYRAVFSHAIKILPDGEPNGIVVEFAFAEPLEVATAVLSPTRVDRTTTKAAAEALVTRLIELQSATLSACEQEVAGWRDELDTYLATVEDGQERQAIIDGIRAAIDKLDRIHASEKHGPAGAGRKLRQKLDDIRSNASARRLRHLREAQVREASGYERYAAIFPVARSLERRFLFLAGPTNQARPMRPSGSRARLSRLRFYRLCGSSPLSIMSRCARTISQPAWSPARNVSSRRAQRILPARSRPWICTVLLMCA